MSAEAERCRREIAEIEGLLLAGLIEEENRLDKAKPPPDG